MCKSDIHSTILKQKLIIVSYVKMLEYDNCSCIEKSRGYFSFQK